MNEQQAYNHALSIRNQYFDDTWIIQIWGNISVSTLWEYYWALLKGPVEVQQHLTDQYVASYISTVEFYEFDSNPRNAVDRVIKATQSELDKLTCELNNFRK